MSDHPSVDDLADSAVGLLPADRAVEVAAHVAGCDSCREQTEALADISAMLASDPPPPVPAGVATRLAEVVRAEQARRTPPLQLLERTPARVRVPRTTLGAFGADLPVHRRGRWLVPALAAAVVAALVGFGGYVLSARAGLNDPPVVAAVNTSELGPDAGELDRRLDLSPHRFTRAWQCAREVTSGRITGIATTTVNGSPALLVYIRSGGTTQVTVVTGCNEAAPSAGPSAVLQR